MVIVKGYFLREGDKGDYVTLQLEGDIELVQSQNTGRFYATSRRCNIYSTFDEETAARMIGAVMHGKIERVACDPYQYTVPETGEEITLNYNWNYNPEESAIPKPKKRKIPKGVAVFSKP